jgi:hypothetical protein
MHRKYLPLSQFNGARQLISAPKLTQGGFRTDSHPSLRAVAILSVIANRIGWKEEMDSAGAEFSIPYGGVASGELFSAPKITLGARARPAHQSKTNKI